MLSKRASDAGHTPGRHLPIFGLGLAILTLGLVVGTASGEEGPEELAAADHPVEADPSANGSAELRQDPQLPGDTAASDSQQGCGHEGSLDCNDSGEPAAIAEAVGDSPSADPGGAGSQSEESPSSSSVPSPQAVPPPEEPVGAGGAETTTTRPLETTTAVNEPSSGSVLAVGPGEEYQTLQLALDAAQPGSVVRLTSAGPHPGPVVSTKDGTKQNPVTITAADGAWLECSSGRCFQLSHSHYRFEEFSIVGGTSNLYMVGGGPDEHVSDVKVMNSSFRGSPQGGTGECLRVKYQASNIEIAYNDIADCGLGKCCADSKNGEGVYIGTAPEQLGKNPSSEPDRTHGVWVHDNIIRSWNECVEMKEASHDNLVEHNTCSGQADDKSGAFGARGGRPGEGNVFRFNLINGALGSCVRFGGDNDPDGSGNDFYGNVCRDISGEWGVKQMLEPQGIICGNVFEGILPQAGLSRSNEIDPEAGCPEDTPSSPQPPGSRI